MNHENHVGLLGLAAAGAVGGVIAAAATTLFQTAWRETQIPPADEPAKQPEPTEKLAEAAAHALAGKTLTKPERERDGQVVHHVVGAAIGVAYVIGARRVPEIRSVRGVMFGLAVWAGLEEIGLSLVGLKPPPWRARPAEHLFGIASHVVFGLSLEAVIGACLGQARFPERRR